MEKSSENAQNKANATTKPKDSKKENTKTESTNQNTIEVSNFGKIDIKFEDQKDIEVTFRKKCIPEGPSEEQMNYWRKLLTIDEMEKTDDWKINSIKIWDDYFDKYKQICKILSLRRLEFDGKSDVFEKNKDKLAEILAEDNANTHMDTLIYGTKRIMIEIMSKMEDPKLNCIIFFLFQTMLDIILLREQFLSVSAGKTINDLIFEDYSSKCRDLELIKTSVLEQKSAELKQKSKDLEHLEQKLRILEAKTNFSATKFKEFNLKLGEFIQNNDVNCNKWFSSVDSIIKRLESCEEKLKKSPKSANLNKVYGLIRKLNSRCNGLHDRIIELEDSYYSEEDLSIKHDNLVNPNPNNDQESKSDDEYEELEDDPENSDISGDLEN